MTLGSVPVRLFGGPLDGDECTIDWSWLPHVRFPLPPRPVWEPEAYLDRLDHPVRPTFDSALYSFLGSRRGPEMWLMHFGYVPLRST